MGDQYLWASFLKGDPQAYENMYSQYYQNLYSYGVRKTNHPDLVRDCIQDLFVHLWTNRANLRQTDNVKYYLLASLRNFLVKASMQNDKRQGVSLDADMPFTMDFDPEMILLLKEKEGQRSKMIVEALEQLTDRQKEAIYLRYFEELSYDEVAELMNISVKGAYKLVYRALEVLKLALNMPKNDILLLLMACRLDFFTSLKHFLNQH
ncbi:RNA polymerase sigma factor [Mucilaginibacter auburnensis]|uniref:RNA polymerase sigma factor (Sigma-70 family) n=1 Tax=Mucilaginibacter auburnensis TaxID=1457233 RepID=A0A2H9VW84_9SPHI|nr:sigma-70 family RNA polymerase sigma factor [Mucilaginibacter auburnensis]PJJ85074.1 RNA polymerase sigma factor (sigma-70 family) [Mucilaginibacter auburnensis]